MDDKLLKKISILKMIAERFNSADVKWSVGSSCLLFFKGIVQEFNDIDIMVSENDIDKVKNIFNELKAVFHDSPNAVIFKTKHFLEYTVEDVDIDIIAGFTIINDNKEYYLPIENEEISESIVVGDTVIILGSLKDWEKYYDLMGRPKKAELIRNYFEKGSFKK